jgi:hypothetical protein
MSENDKDTGTDTAARLAMFLEGCQDSGAARRYLDKYPLGSATSDEK